MVLRRLGSALLPYLQGPAGLRAYHATGAFAAAEASSTGSEAGFSSWLKARQAPRVQVPLTQPLPGVTPETPFRPSLQPPPTEITTLDNGVRIVTEATPGPVASLGLYINSGSIYETEATTGCTALLECLAFKSSTHRDTLTIMKEVEKVGSNVIANASREQMAYTIDCLKTSVPTALELLCDSVLNPAFKEHEVDEQKMRLLMLLQNRDIQTTLMSELMVQRAYEGAYGNPLIPDPQHLVELTPDTLRAFVARHYIGPHMVLAASGVDHGQLVKLVRPMLEGVSPDGSGTTSGKATPKPLPEPSSAYRGGFAALPLLPQDAVPSGAQGYVPPPAANLMLAFEFRGGWRDVHGAVVMTVLNYLLGGGSSFSSGGPGKGMHSRLYTRVLNQYSWVQSCVAFNNTFNESGLVGIQAVCDPATAHDMLNVMLMMLESVGRGVNKVELERAKCAAISVICNALESKATSAEDIGRQMLTYGKRISGRQYVELIQAVTADDIYAFMGRLLNGPPTFVVYGQGVEGLEQSPMLKKYHFQP